MSTRKSLRSTARAVTSPITAMRVRESRLLAVPVPEEKEEVPERRGRREGADVGRAGHDLAGHRLVLFREAVPVGDDAHHLSSFPCDHVGKDLPPLLGAREEEPLPPDPRGKEQLEESPGGVLFRRPVHETDFAASSFVVPGPTLATRRVPGQEPTPSRDARSQKNRAALALAKRIQSKEERRPISRSRGPQSSGCVSRIVGKRTGDAARAPDQWRPVRRPAPRCV